MPTVLALSMITSRSNPFEGLSRQAEESETIADVFRKAAAPLASSLRPTT
jgi:hypothetical protein